MDAEFIAQGIEAELLPKLCRLLTHTELAVHAATCLRSALLESRECQRVFVETCSGTKDKGIVQPNGYRTMSALMWNAAKNDTLLVGVRFAGWITSLRFNPTQVALI